MEQKFVIQNLATKAYYYGEDLFTPNICDAETFGCHRHAELQLLTNSDLFNGYFAIQQIYINVI
jgi:hypothetical protein